MPETKEIIAELGYGDDETFPEVLFLPEEEWVGEEQREFKKILIEKRVIPPHDYYNVFDEDARYFEVRTDRIVKNEEFGGNQKLTCVGFELTLYPDLSNERIIETYMYFGDGSRNTYGSAGRPGNPKQDTWLPRCFTRCKLSVEYLAKYPEAENR